MASLPINLSREVLSSVFNITNGNNESASGSVILYTYGKCKMFSDFWKSFESAIRICVLFFEKGLSRFSDNQIFVYSVYLSNFMRDVVPMVFEIVLHVILIFLLKSYKHRKVRVAGKTVKRAVNRSLSQVERTNLTASFVICILSILMHTVMYLVDLNAFICLLSVGLYFNR